MTDQDLAINDLQWLARQLIEQLRHDRRQLQSANLPTYSIDTILNWDQVKRLEEK